MDAQVPPMPNFKAAAREPTMKDLAAECVNGRPAAGLDLIERLAECGVTVTIDTLVRLANPTAIIAPAAFDHLADALAASHSLRERLP